MMTLEMKPQAAFILSMVVSVIFFGSCMLISSLWRRYRNNEMQRMGSKVTAKQMIRNIPVGNVLDRKKLCSNLARQNFTRLDTYLWESEDWVRIRTKFFPKNVIVGFELSGSKYEDSLKIHTIMGKCYRVSGEENFFPWRQQKERLAALFPFIKILEESDVSDDSLLHLERERKVMKKTYRDYMQVHDVEDLISNPELIQQYAERYCLSRFGNSRKMLDKYRQHKADRAAVVAKIKKKKTPKAATGSRMNAKVRKQMEAADLKVAMVRWGVIFLVLALSPFWNLCKRLGTEKVSAEVVEAGNWGTDSHRMKGRVVRIEFCQDLTLYYQWKGETHTVLYKQAEVPFSGYEAGEIISIYVDKEDEKQIYTAKEFDCTVSLILMLAWSVVPIVCFRKGNKKEKV